MTINAPPPPFYPGSQNVGVIPFFAHHNPVYKKILSLSRDKYGHALAQEPLT